MAANGSALDKSLQAKGLEKLIKFRPKRRDLQFKNLDKDLKDEFYERHYLNIVLEARTLTCNSFAVDGALLKGKTSPWVTEYPDQFYKYVEAVARADPLASGWERLLRDGEERGHLLHAIVMKVLDAQVLSCLLFGASPEHQAILEAEDASLLDLEGFRRSFLRAHTNRTYLQGTDGVPPLFWEEVDRITTEATVMLLPLYNLVREAVPVGSPPLWQLQQWLHNVVAYAGWLNVALRQSPSVTVVEWTKPGDLYEYGLVNLCPPTLDHSRRMASNFDRRMNLGTGLHHARIKISVAPQISRYCIQQVDHVKGRTAYTLMKPHVVFYQGWKSSRDEEEVVVPLEEHIRRVRRPTGHPPYPLVLAIMIVAVVAGVLNFLP